jgi:hypothetical protein
MYESSRKTFESYANAEVGREPSGGRPGALAKKAQGLVEL